jgi:hypothetical protein
MVQDFGHEWEILRGSNVTYKCRKCNTLGHIDVHDCSGHKIIIPNKKNPFFANCDLGTISVVMSI